MSKPNYRVHLTFDSERKLFLARCPELDHCTSEGATRAEAIQKLEEEIDAQLANMLSHGVQPPRSVDEEDFSGQVTAKVSKTLHRDLAYQARNEGLELELFVGELLAQGIEGRKSSHRTRTGNRPQHHDHDNIGNRHDGGNRGNRGFQRGGNPQLLDDRATFIEYVRGLEQGQAGHGGPRHGGHGGGHGGHGGGHGGPGGGRRRGRGGRGGGNPNPNPNQSFRNDRPQHQGGQNGQRNGAPQAGPGPGPQHEGGSHDTQGGGGGFSDEG